MTTQDIQALCGALQTEIARSTYGLEKATQFLTLGYFCGGHVLVEGPPGVGKTLLAKTFAQAVGGEFRRIQFTPDLMPSDITGVSVFDRAASSFRFSPGPLFGDIILADEINRTPPKTQSALLEAMEERMVTVDGKSYPLGDRFFVIATQNSIEFEGTFPLLEAQLDRFFLRVFIDYPAHDVEQRMIETYSSSAGPHAPTLPAVGSTLEMLRDLRQCLRTLRLSPAISDYIVRLSESTRKHPAIALGASPRSGLHLALSAKCWAAMAGRDYVIPDDIQAVFTPVLNHRLVLKPAAIVSGTSVLSVLEEILNNTNVPSEA